MVFSVCMDCYENQSFWCCYFKFCTNVHTSNMYIHIYVLVIAFGFYVYFSHLWPHLCNCLCQETECSSHLCTNVGVCIHIKVAVQWNIYVQFSSYNFSVIYVEYEYSAPSHLVDSNAFIYGTFI